jgi:hypothetical protein
MFFSGKRLVRVLLLSILVCPVMLLSGGCANTTSNFSAAPAPPLGTGVVYFYRVDLDPWLYKVSVKIDESVLFKPKQNEYSWTHLPEGKHLIQIHWPESMGHLPNLEFDLIVESGDVNVIKLTGKSDSGYKEVLFKNEAIVQHSSEGLEAMGNCCKFIQPDENFVPDGEELLIGRSKDIDVGVRYSKTRLMRL